MFHPPHVKVCKTNKINQRVSFLIIMLPFRPVCVSAPNMLRCTHRKLYFGHHIPWLHYQGVKSTFISHVRPWRLITYQLHLTDRKITAVEQGVQSEKLTPTPLRVPFLVVKGKCWSGFLITQQWMSPIWITICLLYFHFLIRRWTESKGGNAAMTAGSSTVQGTDRRTLYIL